MSVNIYVTQSEDFSASSTHAATDACRTSRLKAGSSFKERLFRDLSKILSMIPRQVFPLKSAGRNLLQPCIRTQGSTHQSKNHDGQTHTDSFSTARIFARCFCSSRILSNSRCSLFDSFGLVFQFFLLLLQNCLKERFDKLLFAITTVGSIFWRTQGEQNL